MTISALPPAVGPLVLVLALGACSSEAVAPAAGGTGAAGGAAGDGGAAGGRDVGEGGEGGGGGHTGGASPTGPTSIPDFFRLTATAKGSEGETSVLCKLDFIFELEEDADRSETGVVYVGTHGGEAARIITAAEGDGFAFQADSFGEVIASLAFDDGALRLEIPINVTADSRFWRELALLEGTLENDGTGTGTWTCAPLDIDQGGYVDTTITVDGTWKMEPLP